MCNNYGDFFMKKIFRFSIAVAVFAIILQSCGEKKPEPIKIEGLKEYKDDLRHFSVKYPKNWVFKESPGAGIMAVTADAHRDRFKRYDPTGPVGARMILSIQEIDSTKDLQYYIDKKKLPAEGYEAPVDVTIGGVPGKKIAYKFEQMSDGAFQGEKYIATKDSQLVAIFIVEAFGGTFPAYRKEIDEIVETMVLPVAGSQDTIMMQEEFPPASEKLAKKTGPGFSIMIPDNFNSGMGNAKNAIKSTNFVGMRRRDCNIQVDVLSLEKKVKDLEKIKENFKTQYKSTPKQTTLGGQKGYVVNWNPSAQVNGRVYFTVKDNKLYRISVNWFKGEESDYLPVFEKSIKSFKFN